MRLRSPGCGRSGLPVWRTIEPLGIVRAHRVAAIAYRVLEAAGGALQDCGQPSRGDITMCGQYG
jgi:hypothetical protein